MASSLKRARPAAAVRPGLKVRRIPDWEAAGLAGMLAGLVFMLLSMILTPLFLGGSIWDAPRLIVSLVAGNSVAVPSTGLLLGISVFAHFTLSLIYGRLLAAVLLTRPRAQALWVGAVFGLALFLVNFYGFGAAIPRLAAARNWVWLLCHVVFGLVAAGTYTRLEKIVYE